MTGAVSRNDSLEARKPHFPTLKRPEEKRALEIGADAAARSDRGQATPRMLTGANGCVDATLRLFVRTDLQRDLHVRV